MNKWGGITILLAGLWVTALLPTGEAAPVEYQANGSTITVVGHAQATIAPDIAIVTTGIVTTNASVEGARKDSDLVMQRLIDALAAQGIDQSKITTSQFSLQPQYRNDSKVDGVSSISGYRLQNTITIVVVDLSKTAAVIDTAFLSGANQFQGLTFGLQDDHELRDELLKNAVLDSRHKAEIIASALGVKLGTALAVSESGSVEPIVGELKAFKVARGKTAIEPGTLTMGMDVTAAFSI